MKIANRKSLFGAVFMAAAAIMPASIAHANVPTQLLCIDDQLDLEERAGISRLFADPDTDENDDRRLGNGTEEASSAFATAIGACQERFNWSDPQRQLAEGYLVSLADMGRIGAENGAEWNDAMERFARFGGSMLPDEGEPDDHVRAMIAANAHANGVPKRANDQAAESDIVAFLNSYRKVQEQAARFKS